VEYFLRYSEEIFPLRGVDPPSSEDSSQALCGVDFLHQRWSYSLFSTFEFKKFDGVLKCKRTSTASSYKQHQRVSRNLSRHVTAIRNHASPDLYEMEILLANILNHLTFWSDNFKATALSGRAHPIVDADIQFLKDAIRIEREALDAKAASGKEKGSSQKGKEKA
jgi:hypothetical protein